MKSKQKGQILVMTILLKLIIVTSFLLYSNLTYSAECIDYIDTQYIPYYEANANRYLVRNTPVDDCLTTIILVPSEYARFQLLEEQNSQVIKITSIDIAESFTWGFGTYIGFWFLGFAVKNARMVIRKA